MAKQELSAFSEKRILRGSRAPFSFTKDGRWLVSGNAKGGLSVWSCETPKAKSIELASLDEERLLEAGHDQIATTEDDNLILRDLFTGKILSQIPIADRISVGRWSPNGKFIALVVGRGNLQIYRVRRGSDPVLVKQVPGADVSDIIVDIAWSADGSKIAGASFNAHVWGLRTKSHDVFESDSGLYDVAFSPGESPRHIATGSADGTVDVWNLDTGQKEVVLEGHDSDVHYVDYSDDGTFIATATAETFRLWRSASWRAVAEIKIDTHRRPAFRPRSSQIALVPKNGAVVQLWTIAAELLSANEFGLEDTVAYKTAKIVLVGDSGVGKTGLGWRLAHGEFKEHASTHGQQFWVLDTLSAGHDAERHEAVLWDLAGQPDYRLIHALFIDDADVALVLCDPTHPDNPLKGVEYWLKQLRIASADSKMRAPRGVLIAARCDRGTARVTNDEMLAYSFDRGLGGYYCTSAFSGEGIEDLMTWMRSAIPWDAKPSTITTRTFKAVKDFVLSLKEGPTLTSKFILTLDELRTRVLQSPGLLDVTQDQIQAAVGHLSNHGFVALLRTSKGEQRVLLLPELQNNLAASFVLEARRNIRGLGSLSEEDLLSGRYDFPEARKLSDSDRDILIDSTVSRFLEHNICLRETDPLNRQSYLVFPELINLRRPNIEQLEEISDDVSYLISGATENVYASLVVLLGYTNTFTRINQWKNQARYEVGDGLVCGFRMEGDVGSDIEFILYFGTNVGASVKALFRGLFESFLSRHDVSVRKFEPVACPAGHVLNRIVVREQSSQGDSNAFCPKCGEKIALPDPNSTTQLTAVQNSSLREERQYAERRSRLEQALFRLSAYATEEGKPTKSCFISYAWGNADNERWVEKFSTDLSKAGVEVILDRWHNAQIGASVSRFVEKLSKADFVIVVGTTEYLRKYENGGDRGFIVAAEGDIIGRKMTGSEASKNTVLPLLLDGDPDLSFPVSLRGRVFADFRAESEYFNKIMEILFSIHSIDPRAKIVKDLQKLLERMF